MIGQLQRDLFLDMVQPIDWLHPSSRGLKGFWWGAPGTQGGSRLMDLVNPGPRGNHGALTNMDPASDWVPAGPSPGGYALAFGGATERVLIGASSALEPSNYSAATWMMWVNPTSSSNGRALWGKNQVSDNTYQFFETVVSTDRWLTRVSGTAVTGTKVITFGTWYLLASVWSGTTLSLYVNGVLDGTPAARSGPLTSRAAEQMSIGNDTVDNVPFPGQIAAAYVYDRALSVDEIQREYQSPFSFLRLRRRVYPAVVAAGGGVPYWIFPKGSQMIGGGAA